MVVSIRVAKSWKGPSSKSGQQGDQGTEGLAGRAAKIRAFFRRFARKKKWKNQPKCSSV